MIKNTLIQKYIHPLEPIPTSTSPAGDLTQDIRCILFDIYGTLFISGSGDISLAGQNSPHFEKLEILLTKYKLHLTPRALLDKFHETIKARHRELRSCGVDFPEVQIDWIWQQVLPAENQIDVKQFAVEFELISNPVFPMPNLADLLAACRQKNLFMGIISNAQFYTPWLFEWFLDSTPENLGFNPELVFFSYEFEMAKPSAELFAMAAQKLKGKGLAPSSVLYLGNDMLNDIFPAKNSGFQTALFAGDARSLRLRADDSRCRNLIPDLVVTDLGQLANLICK
jgi:putative hydrolase of the HAD superfamily